MQSIIYKTQNIKNPDLTSSYTCIEIQPGQYEVKITSTGSFFGYWSVQAYLTFEDYLNHVYGGKFIKVIN